AAEQRRPREVAVTAERGPRQRMRRAAGPGVCGDLAGDAVGLDGPGVDACQRLDLGGRPRLTVRVLHPALRLDTDARAVALQVGVGDHGRVDVLFDGAVTADVEVGVDPSRRVEVAVQGGGLTDGDGEVDTER